jgi:hypothetical protein
MLSADRPLDDQENEIMNIRKWLISLIAAGALMMAAPMAMASDNVIIVGPSFFSHDYGYDYNFPRNRVFQPGFRPYLDHGHHVGRHHFRSYQRHRFSRFRHYGHRPYSGYRYRGQPSFRFYYRY